MTNEEIIEIKETQHDINSKLDELKQLLIEQRENPLSMPKPPVLEDSTPAAPEEPKEATAEPSEG